MLTQKMYMKLYLSQVITLQYGYLLPQKEYVPLESCLYMIFMSTNRMEKDNVWQTQWTRKLDLAIDSLPRRTLEQCQILLSSSSITTLTYVFEASSAPHYKAVKREPLKELPWSRSKRTSSNFMQPMQCLRWTILRANGSINQRDKLKQTSLNNTDDATLQTDVLKGKMTTPRALCSK